MTRRVAACAQVLFAALALAGCGAGEAAVRDEHAAREDEETAAPAAPDRDADGVPDASDRCACDPEDRDGFEDGDGCRDDDNDADGIADVCDRCPDAPETMQGACDDDGCPDRSHNCVAQRRIEIGERIGFALGGAEVDAEGRGFVDALAAALASSPHIERIEVTGHATPAETRASALGRRRADAVIAALTSAGIDTARTLARGLPPAAASEGDALEGRYVEFLVVRVAGEDWPDGTPPEGSAFGGCAPPVCQPVSACVPPAPPRACAAGD